MEEVLVDVGEEAARLAEEVEGPLEAVVRGARLVGGQARQGSGHVEDDGGLLVREGELGDLLCGERIVPWEGHAEVGEAELQQLELAKVLEQQVPRRQVGAGRAPQRVLAAPVQVGAFVGVAARVLLVHGRDDAPDGLRDVDILRRLLRARNQRGSRHPPSTWSLTKVTLSVL
jgi:hypothetical protein